MQVDLTPTTAILLASQLKPPKPQIPFAEMSVGTSAFIELGDADYIKRIRNIVAWQNKKNKDVTFVVYIHRADSKIEIARLK